MRGMIADRIPFCVVVVIVALICAIQSSFNCIKLEEVSEIWLFQKKGYDINMYHGHGWMLGLSRCTQYHVWYDICTSLPF